LWGGKGWRVRNSRRTGISLLVDERNHVGLLPNNAHITYVICVCTHSLLTGRIHRLRPGPIPALARTCRPTGTKPARLHLPSRSTRTRAEPARALMHDSARVCARRPYVGGVLRLPLGGTAPTPHSARALAVLRLGRPVRLRLLLSPPAPLHVRRPHTPRASSPICTALRPPPAKSGQGASAHPPSAPRRRRRPPLGLGRGRTGQRLGRGWGGGRAADADARPAVRRVRRVWRAVGVERPASANVVSVRRGGEEAQYARLYGDAGGYAGATPILHPYALLGLG
jgi:hypothetical protein